MRLAIIRVVDDPNRPLFVPVDHITAICTDFNTGCAVFSLTGINSPFVTTMSLKEFTMACLDPHTSWHTIDVVLSNLTDYETTLEV